MTAEFDERYRIGGEPVMRRVEQRVLGADYGATSYTTKAQADRLIDLLDLRPDKLLLDIGAGAGWPGIYLAQSSGSRVVLIDRPIEGLRAAIRRMTQEGVAGHVAAATGDLAPFGDGTFEAVSSSDVLC